MAINRVDYAGSTLIDISNTTAAAADVASGKYFYTAAGVRTAGTNSGGGGTSKNVQIASGVNRASTTSYVAVDGQALTVAKTGIYDVYWNGFRSTSSGTNGSRLYIDGAAYGTAQTTFTNQAQNVHLSGVSLTQGQTVEVWARARAANYYMYVGNLTIIEA